MAKYLTRKTILKNKISNEMSQPKPDINNMIKIVEEYETANIETIKFLQRNKAVDDNKIKGALKQTINAHGPITVELIGSATKRINGSLMLSDNFIPPTSTSVQEYQPFISVKSILIGIGLSVIIQELIKLIF